MKKYTKKNIVNKKQRVGKILKKKYKKILKGGDIFKFQKDILLQYHNNCRKLIEIYNLNHNFFLSKVENFKNIEARLNQDMIKYKTIFEESKEKILVQLTELDDNSKGDRKNNINKLILDFEREDIFKCLNRAEEIIDILLSQKGGSNIFN